MKITFLKNHRPAGDSPTIPTYGKGQTYNFDGAVAEGYARKYIRLGYAEEAIQKRPGPVTVYPVGQDEPVVFRGKDAEQPEAVVPLPDGGSIPVKVPRFGKRRS